MSGVDPAPPVEVEFHSFQLSPDIRGVPFFVVDGRYGVSGAQSPEVFTEVLVRTITDEEASAI